jgi:hypothetical protein
LLANLCFIEHYGTLSIIRDGIEHHGTLSIIRDGIEHHGTLSIIGDERPRRM